MVNIIETIVKPLVDFPDDVRVSEEQNGKSINYVLSVNPDDMGKVIGKRGRIAQAIRTVVYAAGHANNKYVHLTIND